MDHTTPALLIRDKRRAWRDRLTRYVVSAGGMVVLAMLMLIFVYLLVAVWPLFKPASIGQPQALAWPKNGNALAVGVDATHQMVWRIDENGKGMFLALQPADKPLQPLQEQPFTATAPSAAASMNGDFPTIALATVDGKVLLVSPQFHPVGKTGDTSHFAPDWVYLRGSTPEQFDDKHQPLRQLSVGMQQHQPMIAALTQDGRVLLGQPASTGWQVNQIEVNAPVSQVLLSPEGSRLFVLSPNQLSVFPLSQAGVGKGQNIIFDPQKPAQKNIVRMALLPGASSLLLQNAKGQISQWFDVQRNGQRELTEIRHYQPALADSMLINEPYRRVFAALAPSGKLELYSSLRENAVLQTSIESGVKTAWFDPQGKGLLVETMKGAFWYPLNNDYPEISWKTLLKPTWFENYPQPDYVWQTTSGSDNYQAKYSLWPVVFGTLKAAFYALLFATPLAVAGAIYTACFMSARQRSVVKPAIEMIGAFPTVVIGLVAAIWLAPIIENHLLALLALPVLIPLVIVGGAALWTRLFPALAQRTGYRFDVCVLLPLLTILLVLWFMLAPHVEILLWGMPLHERLGDGYDQRNTLVVAIALGFALVPVIFSLAEDALFSVPASLAQGSLALGATQWQTLMRVLLPSASAGIFSALMIGLGRAVGETMIVLMATGNTPLLDNTPFQGLRALAANIAIEMPEAVVGSAHYRVLFLTALVLFLFTFIVNTLAEAVRLKLRLRYSAEREGL
ncbi:ABC transporter permease subunit [Hafnia paralvei]|uniref:ABC transporter permease subunit n=1 Tax=Hafnia TaxID=568 RepID=UPI0008A5E1DA|nr:ABC transporter permease subunit [Hafnia sp. HMSC23F03]OFS07812.1 ABC transporter permease [Hafnia sp. HMSC23F03]